MADKQCPECAEKVKRDAKVCRFCNYRFPETPPAPQASPAATGIGCGVLALMLLALAMCARSEAPVDPKAEAAKQAEEAEKRRQGFHCLSGWDGSLPALVDSIKENLREPSSFEHVETRITPVNAKGEHVLMMKYRARNGFGGMNLGTVLATVKNSDCSFTIVSSG